MGDRASKSAIGNSTPFLFSSSYICTTPVRSGLLRKASAHAWEDKRGLLGSISHRLSRGLKVQAAQLLVVSEARAPLYPDARALAKPTRPLLLPVLSQCGWQHPGRATVLLSMNNTPNSGQPMQRFLGEEPEKFYPSCVARWKLQVFP